MAKSTLKGAKKATKYRAREADKEKPFDVKQSRLNRSLDSYEDTMGGDEDQFHLNRDKMLLDEDGYAQNGDDDSLDEPDEIYGLNLPDADSASDADEDDHEEEEEAAPAASKLNKHKQERKEKKPIYDPKSGRFGHTYDPKQDQVFDSSSGEEASDDDDDDEGDETSAPAKDQLESTVSSDDEGADGKKGSGSESEDEDRWAAGHYHVSRRAPGEADSEDEEALELEAEEARRLQKKGAERLRGEDYGLVDSDDELDGRDKLEERLDLDAGGREADAQDEEEGKVDTRALNEEESIAHLLKYSPETLALVDDFVRTASKIKDVEGDLDNIRQAGDGQGGEHPGLAIMELEHQALSTYLPTLAFYFSLLLSPTPQPQSLLTKVLGRISSLRQSLATMEELDLTSANYGDDDSEADGEEGDEFDDGKMLASEMFDFHNGLNEDDDEDDEDEDSDEEGAEITESMLEGLDDDELEEIMQDVSPEEGAEGLMKRVRQRQREKGMQVSDSEDDDMSEGDASLGSDDEEEEEEDEDEELAPPTKKAKASSAPVIPTLAPLSSSARTKNRAPASSTARSAASTSDYLDPAALSHGDLADKASSRHSLRFHVSQVAQKAARRERLATAVGGDDDVPRRSKEQARREVLKKQQHGAKDAAGAGLDGGDWDEDDRKAAKAVRGSVNAEGDDGGNDDEDYYDLVKMEKDEGRKSKKAKYDGDRAAEKAEIEALSASMADGPRGATRQILANKGLTPRRKKENRNARVKKRLRYDKAQKKLSSMKATYKGGESRSGYEGEGSGIARKTVKSRQLG
ncbi:hypothetical protein JCM11491_000509 [Sporobolomyces phaffii]